MSDEVNPAAPVTETTTVATTKSSGPPPPVADDNARKVLTGAVVVQFVIVIAYIIHSTVAKEASNAEMMILGAEIGFVTTLLNYYFGSSSGSTLKSSQGK